MKKPAKKRKVVIDDDEDGADADDEAERGYKSQDEMERGYKSQDSFDIESLHDDSDVRKQCADSLNYCWSLLYSGGVAWW